MDATSNNNSIKLVHVMRSFVLEECSPKKGGAQNKTWNLVLPVLTELRVTTTGSRKTTHRDKWRPLKSTLQHVKHCGVLKVTVLLSSWIATLNVVLKVLTLKPIYICICESRLLKKLQRSLKTTHEGNNSNQSERGWNPIWNQFSSTSPKQPLCILMTNHRP